MGYAIRIDGVYGWRAVRSANDCRGNETYSKVKPGPYEPTDEDLAEAVRAERDRLLANTDWTQLTDAPMSDDEREAWAVYRQALRDVPQQGGFPDAVEWPETPLSGGKTNA
jgi:hypothetical protein